MIRSTFQTSKSNVISALKKAAKELDLELKENKANEITLFHSGGLLSFGNKISVKISQNVNDQVKVSISSRSAAQVQLIDWGTNTDLETDLMKKLKNIIAK